MIQGDKHRGLGGGGGSIQTEKEVPQASSRFGLNLERKKFAKHMR